MLNGYLSLIWLRSSLIPCYPQFHGRRTLEIGYNNPPTCSFSPAHLDELPDYPIEWNVYRRCTLLTRTCYKATHRPLSLWCFLGLRYTRDKRLSDRLCQTRR